MEGNNMKILRKILMVMIMVAMVVTSTSFAAGDYSITVTVDKKHGDVTGKMSLWKVKDEQIPDSEKATELGDLNKLSVDNLNSRYKNATEVEFSNNEAVFKNLDRGAYYVRDTSGIKRNKEIASILVNLPDDVEGDSKNVTIHAKESSTNVRLVKVDESGNPLKGAKFKLLVRRGSEYVELKNKATMKKDDKLELSPKDDDRSKVKSEENTDKSKDANSKSEKDEATEEKDDKKSKEEKTEDKESKDDKSKEEDKSSDEGLYISNESGEIIINDIKKGDYIFREVEAPAGYLIKNVDTKFTISDKSVELRVVNSKTTEKDKGRHDFMKTDEAKKPLGGAMFKVMTKNKDGKFEPVKKDGKDYIVTSADNGKFAVEDMDYGKYYLVEIKAPAGFILLSEPVEFEIKKQADDKTISIAFITNKSDTITRRRTTPGGDITRGGKIPKTGDIRFFMSMIGGAIMFFIGKWIIAKDDKLIGKNIK